MTKRTAKRILRSRRNWRKWSALARDAKYARAHLGLAEAYIGLGVYQYIPTIEANEEATRALHDAERLQPNLALIHVLSGS